MENNQKTLQQLDKASELLWTLSYAIEKGLTDEMEQSWINSAKKLSRDIDNHVKYLTDLETAKSIVNSKYYK
tara:strand:+ start:997 stop:1212 length:216 start_codon:yes stop_codon:yes gene_type:complete